MHDQTTPEIDLKVELTLTAVCNALPFVTWDRLTIGDLDDDSYGQVFGWIPRSDGQRDFVIVTSWASWDTVNFNTSSAKYSEEINAILFGAGAEHGTCKRVEDLLPNVIAKQADAAEIMDVNYAVKRAIHRAQDYAALPIEKPNNEQVEARIRLTLALNGLADIAPEIARREPPATGAPDA